MKHKVAELNGALLDLAVALVEGKNIESHAKVPAYSSDWALGGPIVDRERITCRHFMKLRKTTGERGAWLTLVMPLTGYKKPAINHVGDTLLISAMRTYVGNHHGDVVDLPT